MRFIEETICCSSTKIFIGRNIAKEVLRNEINGKVLLLRQQVVDPRYIIDALEDNLYEIALPGGDQIKNIETIISIIKLLSEKGFQRRDYIIALGGGALTDIAGFIASIYMRGMRLINIPTTILGMVDAALGGKNAINFHGIKNIVGTFYQPHIVLSDLIYLETLPQKELINGLAEVIKYGIVLDHELFTYLAENKDKVLNRDIEAIENIIYRSTINKLSIVKQDPYEERNIRIVLNYGHTIGHAIESASNFNIPHGMAVSIGMVCEAIVGKKVGVTNEDTIDKIINIIKIYGLPIHIDDLNIEIDEEKLYNAITRDKKRYGDYISIPLPITIGCWTPYRIPIDNLASAVRECLG
jgi:3-dehydroquinate synthase